MGEFLRRFALPILPERFTKIRHYGVLANRGRQERIGAIRATLEVTRALSATESLAPERALVLVRVLSRPQRRGFGREDTS